jgi:hypothetical protein
MARCASLFLPFAAAGPAWAVPVNLAPAGTASAS